MRIGFSSDYNREVGGVSNSTHIDGLAADIYCDGLSTEALYDICLKVIGPRGGVGYYPKSGFVHVDLSPTTLSDRVRTSLFGRWAGTKEAGTLGPASRLD